MPVLFELLGFGAITTGVWQIDHPAGVITGGVLAVALGVLTDGVRIPWPWRRKAAEEPTA